jgi:predicted nucleic acid-binding protein
MVYLDTNILVYASINQDEAKRQTSLDLIEELVSRDTLVLSVLSLQELAFTLAKVGLDVASIESDVEFYQQFVKHPLDLGLIQEAFQLAVKGQRLTSFNDAIHATYAKHYAMKLMTFDRDFTAFQSHTSLSIEVIR